MRLTINLLALTILLGSFSIQAQEKSLVLSFEDILAKAETYEKYKVIKREDLVGFKRSLTDSLQDLGKAKNGLEEQVALLTQKVDLLNEKLLIAESSLQNSQLHNDVIGFLGLKVKKGTYHAIIWSFITLLLLVLGVIYARIKHACAVVKRVKEAYTRILEEYRAQRFAATEKQMKLKRELQTALNHLEDLREVEGQSM